MMRETLIHESENTEFSARANYDIQKSCTNSCKVVSR